MKLGVGMTKSGIGTDNALGWAEFGDGVGIGRSWIRGNFGGAVEGAFGLAISAIGVLFSTSGKIGRW